MVSMLFITGEKKTGGHRKDHIQGIKNSNVLQFMVSLSLENYLCTCPCVLSVLERFLLFHLYFQWFPVTLGELINVIPVVSILK